MNNTLVREIYGAKINPKSSLKIRVRKICGGANYMSKCGILANASVFVWSLKTKALYFSP
jgi:hypothetical protein